MNLFRKELKSGLKPFLFWTLGLFVFIIAGILKSSAAMADGQFMTELINKFPRIVVVAMGMANIDISQFAGFYAVLMQYVFVLAAVYAAYLGSNAVSRESVDKTYEFLFTKPRSRSYILARKLLAALVYFTLYACLNLLFSVLAVRQLALDVDYLWLYLRFSVAMWAVGLVFFSIAAMFAASMRVSERGARAGNLTVLATYALAVVYDLFEKPGAIRLLTPFRYFLNTEVLDSVVQPLYLVLCVALAIAFLLIAFIRFEKRDLGAV
ncbi:MAG: ABC transporter permease subunit [Eubacteriales bacterium]|nr:ABC transporter permease subunit [Eubacteriales bacterium]